MRNSFETVEEIEKSGKTMLLAEEVRNILGLNPNSIRRQAQEDRSSSASRLLSPAPG